MGVEWEVSIMKKKTEVYKIHTYCITYAIIHTYIYTHYNIYTYNAYLLYNDVIYNVK